MKKIGLVLFFVLASISIIISQTMKGLSLPDQPEGVIRFDVSFLVNENVDALSYDFLSVSITNGADEPNIIPIQGNYSIIENSLVFKPYFPFDPGLTYVVKIQDTNTEEYSYFQFQTGEKAKVDQAKLLNIFPSANLLPENLLRFYIYFQTPMTQGQSLDYIKLIDKSGKIDEHAFMQFKEELWSSDGKRLTLLFDPGRIKRGVSTNMKQGPSLENEQQYTLSISNEWKDIYGQTLEINSTNKITITDAYRKKMKIEEWTITTPSIGSKGKLTLRFDRILDHALIQSMIQIRDFDNNLIEGSWKILDSEQEVKFAPKSEWKKGNYKIQIDTHIEDVAGNNLQNLLDHPIMDQGINDKFQYLNFKI